MSDFFDLVESTETQETGDVVVSNQENSNVLDVSPSTMDNLIAVSEEAEKRIAAINKIKQIALRVTNPQDWVNQGGKPYLQSTGAEKVARMFGISWRIDEPLVETSQDGHYQYTYKGIFSLKSDTIEAIGVRGSKDDFFGVKYVRDSNGVSQKTTLPPTEVDRSNVKKSAYTNCIVNGITRILGIRNLTWEDISAAKIDVSKIATISYLGKTEMTEDAKKMRDEISAILKEMSGGDAQKASKILQDSTSFVGRDGTKVQGKKSVDEISEKAMPITLSKLKQLKGAK